MSKSVLGIKQPQIATVDKGIRKDNFSQYSKSGKTVFRNIRNPERYFLPTLEIREDSYPQIDHVVTRFMHILTSH